MRKKLKSKKSKKKKKKDAGEINLVFIGVHIRKTDAELFYVQVDDKSKENQHNEIRNLLFQKYNLPSLEPSYYLQAFDFYRQKFKHSGAFISKGNEGDLEISCPT